MSRLQLRKDAKPLRELRNQPALVRNGDVESFQRLQPIHYEALFKLRLAQPAGMLKPLAILHK